MDKFIKLKDLIGSSVTIQSVDPYVYKMWSDADKRFVTSQTHQEGFSKKYPVTTDKGKLDLGSGQIGSLLTACFRNGAADLIGKTFSVKSNGKEGMDVRYFFDLTEIPAPELVKDTIVTEVPDQINLDGIPF